MKNRLVKQPAIQADPRRAKPKDFKITPAKKNRYGKTRYLHPKNS